MVLIYLILENCHMKNKFHDKLDFVMSFLQIGNNHIR
jgi:hypothetical protein